MPPAPQHSSALDPRGAFPSICIAVSAETAEQLFVKAGHALRVSPLVELRLDALPQPAAALEGVAALCRAHPQAAILATCRRKAGGGGFDGSPDEQITLLEECAAAGASLVDLEVETLELVDAPRLALFGKALHASGCRLVVSAHDFNGPGIPAASLDELQRLAAPASPAVYKVVNTAHQLCDNLPMLRLVEQAAARGLSMTGICMGEAGIPSRVLALRAGAPFTFGSLEEHGATAPGQVTASVLQEQYNAPRLGPHTRLYGVAGNPVTHSLSPALHNAAFRAAGIDAVYLPLHTTSVRDLVHLARELPLDGISVTMPWKVEILPLLDSVDSLAAAIGAVNTVARGPDGRLHGTNTDAAAVVEPLLERLPLKGARVLLAGAGGAARAAAFALVRAGALVSILNRTPELAEKLARSSGAAVADPQRLQGFDVIVNATPAGMLGPPQNDMAVPQSALTGARVVFEMVYRPRATPLVRRAQALGIEVVDGLNMFVHQGARQWETWTGQEAPVESMRAALETALGEWDAEIS